jgi:hypothetical protein
LILKAEDSGEMKEAEAQRDRPVPPEIKKNGLPQYWPDIHQFQNKAEATKICAPLQDAPFLMIMHFQKNIERGSVMVSPNHL